MSPLAPTWPLLLGAVALDLLIGDPIYPLHPVRLMGGALSRFEHLLRKTRLDGYGGGCLLLVLLACTWVFAPSLLVVKIHAASPWLAWLVHLFVVYSLIALRDLLRHGWNVERALRRDDLQEARRAVTMLVGRDTQQMDAGACRRAVIESLAENTVDGFISPLFWYSLFGLPGLLLFKVVSTMDSMVGYKTPQYIRFGWCGVRSDDLMNWLPARLTWLVMTLAASMLAGTSARKAFRVGWHQHALVPGPNSGWSEAATAGGIQRRLVGPLWRDGALVTTIWLGDPCDPEAGSAEDFLTACRFILVVCALWVAATAVFLAS
ncbi:MAG: cobalamin biosynthesis protein CobD [Deltaproteobacteria bacterium]|nr:cobalamin biosynthesis protein CobD [Deltaproteobacteria bacterium]